MPTENDPLAEAEAPCRCDGGWVQVRPAYALHLYPDPPADVVADLPAEAHQELLRQLDLKRKAATNSWYPCRVHRPALFYRWVGGHLSTGHDVAACDECIQHLGGRRAARRALAHLPDTPTTEQRRDLV